ncbi:MAG: antitoxin VapB family protein [Nitrososphaerales archaeon]
MYLSMGFKTITISDEAYKRLKRLKGKKESFTDIILRLSEGKGNILTHAGKWKDMNDREAEDFFKIIEEAWSRWQVKKSA